MADSSSPIPGALAAARAAAPADEALRAAWAEEMGAFLAGLTDAPIRDALARAVAQLPVDVTWLDPAEMLRFAEARLRATARAGAPLEVRGLVNADLHDATRDDELRAELRTLWEQPPSAVQALSADEQAFLHDLHARMVTTQRNHLGARHTRSDAALEVARRYDERRSSGLKLHVSARSTAETVELVARLLPVLPDGSNFKVASAKLLARQLTALESEQQRKAITIYLPPAISTKQLSEILHALHGERSYDPIAGEHELIPGVYLRSEFGIRFADGVNTETYAALYRPARAEIREGDVVVRALLARRPDLIADFKDDIVTISDGMQFDARVAVMRSALKEYFSTGLTEVVALNHGLGVARDEHASATPQQLQDCFDHLCALQVLTGEGRTDLNRVTVLDETAAVIRAGRHLPARTAALQAVPELEAMLGMQRLTAKNEYWIGARINRAVCNGVTMFFATERNTQYEVVRSSDRVQITVATAGTPPVRFAPVNEPVTRIDLTDDGRLHITGASGATWQSQPVRYISDERALHPDAFATVRTPHAAPDSLGR